MSLTKEQTRNWGGGLRRKMRGWQSFCANLPCCAASGVLRSLPLYPGNKANRVH